MAHAYVRDIIQAARTVTPFQLTGDYAARETWNDAGRALELTLETDLDFWLFLDELRTLAPAMIAAMRPLAEVAARYEAGNVGLALNCEYGGGFAFPGIFVDTGTTPVVIVSFPPASAKH